MKYIWYKIKLVDIKKQIGIQPKSIVKGMIPTTEMITNMDGVLVPKQRIGIELEFTEKLTTEQLQKLDDMFSDMTREGNISRNFAAEITELKARIEKLEKQAYV